MSMDKCPNCGIIVCDAVFYYKDKVRSKKGKSFYEYPKCEVSTPAKEWKQ